jgi:Tfp pilus assembly protein PilO
VFFFFTKDQFAQIELVQADMAKYEEAVSRAQELNSELKRKIDQKRSYSPDVLERLNALVPTEINEVKILTDLNEIARSHNMLFGNVSVENTGQSSGRSSGDEPLAQRVSYPDIQNTALSFSLIGTYEQFKSFLADVEQSLVLMEVSEIKFSSGEGNLQQFEMVVTVFALPPLQ